MYDQLASSPRGPDAHWPVVRSAALPRTSHPERRTELCHSWSDRAPGAMERWGAYCAAGTPLAFHSQKQP